jgi:hypothetical protein
MANKNRTRKLRGGFGEGFMQGWGNFVSGVKSKIPGLNSTSTTTSTTQSGTFGNPPPQSYQPTSFGGKRRKSRKRRRSRKHKR